MALLFTSTISALASHQDQYSASGFVAYPAFRFPHKSAVTWQPKSYFGGNIRAPFAITNRGLLIVKASSEIDGTGSVSPDPPTPPSDNSQEGTPVENLPLEPKLQLKLEQKMKMKMAKKIRLRRKRLVRKRHLRKKGRWPPSKLKKNKNV